MAPFIYALADPREAQHIRYVGMSLNANRPYDHAKAARKSKRKSHLYSWIQLLLAGGHEPLVSLIEQCDQKMTREELGEREKHHIDKLRKEGHDLTNMTPGGDGWPAFKGRRHTEETRAKMRKAGETRVQHAQTPETRAKIGNANRGKQRSPEIKAKYSACQKGRIPWNKGKQIAPVDATTERKYRKVTPEDIREIRAAWPAKSFTDIAKRFNISAGTVHHIVRHGGNESA